MRLGQKELTPTVKFLNNLGYTQLGFKRIKYNNRHVAKQIVSNSDRKTNYYLNCFSFFLPSIALILCGEIIIFCSISEKAWPNITKAGLRVITGVSSCTRFPHDKRQTRSGGPREKNSYSIHSALSWMWILLLWSPPPHLVYHFYKCIFVGLSVSTIIAI